METVFLNFVLQVIECLIFFEFYESVKPSSHKNKTLFLLLVGYVVMFGVNIAFDYNVIVNLIVFSVFHFLFSFYLYKFKFRFCLLYLFLSECLVLITEIVALELIAIITNSDTRECFNDTYSYILLIGLCKSLLFVLLKVVSFIINKFNSSDSVRYSIMLYPVSLLLVLVDFTLISSEVDLSHNLRVMVSVSGLILIIVVIATCLFQQKESQRDKELSELRSEQQKQAIDTQYLQIIEQNNKNSAILIHDIKNHLQHIKSMDATEEIHSYIESISDEVQSYGYIGMSKNKTLDLLISKYLNLCQGKGIKIDFDVKTANLSNVAPTDISTIFNNLLDNAVEAAEQSEKKEISVSIFRNQGYEVLKVQNSCDSKPQSKNGKLLTTKKEKQLHGYGTQSVIKTVDKYDGMFDWEYSENERIFTVTVAMPT